MIDISQIRAMISAEVDSRLAALGLGTLTPQVLEELALVALEQACAQRMQDLRDGDEPAQPLNPSPAGNLDVYLAECTVNGHGTAKTWKTVAIGATTVTLSDNATNYLWAKVDLQRESLEGTFYYSFYDASLVVNTSSGYATSTETGQLPSDATAIRVIPLGSITTASGKITAMDVRKGHIWFCAPELTLPEGEQGEMLYHDGDDWVVLDNPGSSSYGHALTLKDDGSIPEWVAIERVKVVCTVEIDGGKLRMTRADLDVIRKQADDDYETIVELGTCE
jgi:hypothetical protein